MKLPPNFPKNPFSSGWDVRYGSGGGSVDAIFFSFFP